MYKFVQFLYGTFLFDYTPACVYACRLLFWLQVRVGTTSCSNLFGKRCGSLGGAVPGS